MSSIGSIGMSNMQRPDPKDLFKKIDSDGSGEVSQAELQKLADKMNERTGKTLDVSDDAFKSYDSDGSGSLSADELKTVMDNSGFGPSQGMQGMAPPPPPPQQATDSYNSNSSSTEQDTVSALVSNLKALLEKLTANSAGSDESTSKKDDFFGKVDTDSSGKISKDEMKTLAANLKEMTGQTLDVSDEAFKGYDSDGDGELTSKELKTAMDKNGFKGPQGPPPGPPPGDMQQAQSASSAQSAQTDSSSLPDQMKELKNLLKTLSKYADSNNNGSDSLFSVTS